MCPARIATRRLEHTKCPVCGMVFTLCLVRHVVGGSHYFLVFFTRRHVTGWLLYTLCPVCVMVFTLCLVWHVVGGWPLFFCFRFFTKRHVTGWLVYTLCPACHVTGRSLIPRPDPVYTIITRDPPLRGLHGICAEKLSTAWALGPS